MTRRSEILQEMQQLVDKMNADAEVLKKLAEEYKDIVDGKDKEKSLSKRRFSLRR